MVAVSSDAIVIGRSFVDVGTVLGDNGGRHREGRGGGQAGAGVLVLLSYKVNTLKGKKRGLWTEGSSKCGMDAGRSKKNSLNSPG